MPQETSQVWTKILRDLWSQGLSLSRIADRLAVPEAELNSLLFGIATPVSGRPTAGAANRSQVRMLDAKHESSYHARHEQAPSRQARSDPRHAVRGGFHALRLAAGGRVHQHGVEAAVDAGKACATSHDDTVRDVRSKRIQCDEIWSFTAAKQKNVAAMKAPVDGAGDTWTWTGARRRHEAHRLALRRRPGRRVRHDVHGRRRQASRHPRAAHPRTATGLISTPWRALSGATWTSLSS